MGTTKRAAKKSSAKKPRSKVKPAKPFAAPNAVISDDDYDPSPDRVALNQLVAAWGKPSAEDTAAFASLVTDDTCSQLGKRTKAEKVSRGAVRYASTIHRAFGDHGDLVEQHYSKARFAFFLAVTSALSAQIVKDRARRGTSDGQKSSLATVEANLRAARKKLVSKLRTVLAEGSALAGAFKAALGSDAGDLATLARGTMDVVAVAKHALASADPKLARICVAEGPTDTLVPRRRAPRRTPRAPAGTLRSPAPRRSSIHRSRTSARGA